MENRIAELEAENASLEVKNAEYKAENERLIEIIRNFQRRHFKSQSEQSRLILQMNLFDEAETIAEQDPESPDEEIIWVKSISSLKLNSGNISGSIS